MQPGVYFTMPEVNKLYKKNKELIDTGYKELVCLRGEASGDEAFSIAISSNGDRPSIYLRNKGKLVGKCLPPKYSTINVVYDAACNKEAVDEALGRYITIPNNGNAARKDFLFGVINSSRDVIFNRLRQCFKRLPLLVLQNITDYCYSRRSVFVSIRYKIAKFTESLQLRRYRHLLPMLIYERYTGFATSPFFGSCLVNNNPPLLSPAPVTGGVCRPFGYQVLNLRWMLALEQHCKERQWKRIIPDSWPYFEIGNGKVFDTITGYLLNSHRGKKEVLIRSRGGVLADETGMGKTITALMLITSDKGKGCSLVVCPSYLCAQWENQTRTNFPEVRPFVVRSIRDIRKLQCKVDIGSLDLIIASQSFINGKVYENDHRVFQLHSHNWNRVVLDEAHTYPALSRLRSKCKSLLLSDSCKWYLSATPFPSAQSLLFCSQFLGVEFKTPYYHTAAIDELIHSPFIGAVTQSYLQFFYRRNLVKNLTVSDNQFPGVVQTQLACTLSPIERYVYNVFSKMNEIDPNKYMRCLVETCTGGLYKNGQAMLDNCKRKLNTLIYTLNYKLRKLDEEIEYIKLLPGAKCNDYYREVCIPRKVKKRAHISTGMAVLLDISQNYMQTHDAYKSTKVWAVKANMPRSDLLLIDTYGTKCALLLKQILYLYHQNADNKIAVFSQFTYVLLRLQEYLKRQQILSKTIRGNVYIREKALKLFQSKSSATRKRKTPEPTCRVLLLSLLDSAAGADLTEGTHMIIFDNLIIQSDSISKLINVQSIGRIVRQCKVKKAEIIKCVVENTIDRITH